MEEWNILSEQSTRENGRRIDTMAMENIHLLTGTVTRVGGVKACNGAKAKKYMKMEERMKGSLWMEERMAGGDY